MKNNDDLFRADPLRIRPSSCEAVYVTVPPLHPPSASWWVEAGDDTEEFRRKRDARLADMKKARFGQNGSVLIIDGFSR